MKRLIRHWLPSALLMLAVFLASSRPADRIPDFGAWDRAVKKAGHMLGFGLLALAYQHGITSTRSDRTLEASPRSSAPGGSQPRSARAAWLAWVLALLYALTDEVHQSYVPGRQASVSDVLVFDSVGAAVALLLSRALTHGGRRAGG